MGGVSFAQTTVDFSSGLPSNWEKVSGTVQKQTYTKKVCIQLQEDATIKSPTFSNAISHIKINLARSKKGTNFTIKCKTSTAEETIKEITNTKDLTASGTWTDFDIDIPSNLQEKNCSFTFTSTVSSYYISSIEFTEASGGSDKTNTTLSFGDLTSKTLLVGETFTATPTLKAGDTEVTGKTLTYKSSDEDVATVSDKGVVEAKKPGNTTITANFAGDDTYSASSASYAVKVAVNDIATLKSLITSTDTKNPQSFTLKLTDAVVTYTNNNTAYIQDASGAIYIYTSHGLDANQKINGFADVKVCKFKGLNEITSWTLADDATVTDDGTFTVETVTLADLTNNFDKYESMPVKVAGATVTKDFVSQSGEISQDGTTFVVYNKGTSSVTLGSIGDNIDIVGYPAIYNSTKQLYLWKQSDITKNSSKVATVMAFSESEVKVAAGSKDVTTPTLTLTANGEDILAGKTITYSSTDKEVAIVDEKEGDVVLMGKEGTTTITATFAGDDTYAGATASYTLTVYDPNKTEITFDFQKPEDYGYGTSSSSKHDGDVAVDGTIVSGIVTITNTKNGSTTTRFWSDGLRIYNGATLTFSVPAGYKIVSVVGNKSINITNANSNSVTYSVTTNTTLTSLTVTYKESIDYTFDDTQDYTPVLDENKSVKIKRSMSADQLNTICLPFDLSEEQISTTFGSGTEVYEFLGVIDNVLHFSTTAKMSATKPYLITPTETKSELIFSNIDVITDDAASKVTDGEFALCGTFGPATLKTDGTELFLAAGGILKKPAQGSNSNIKGFRAYFSVPANTNDAKISLGGFETSIDNISIDGMKLKNNQVYNLNGQLVGNSLNGLAKGIYLMNGKKYVVK